MSIGFRHNDGDGRSVGLQLVAMVRTHVIKMFAVIENFMGVPTLLWFSL